MRSVSMTPRITIVSVALVAGLAGSCSLGEFPGSPAPAMSPGAVILATTSSTYDTGLLEQLIEHFEVTGGVRVKTIVAGSGKALALAERGEADLVLVHAPTAEKRFMESGAGLARRRMMYNDFILVGPESDPAGVGAVADVLQALRAIERAGIPFVSRGDESGTHQLERALWERIAIRPRRGDRYLETGQGMGMTLRVASERRAYTLADRGTYLAQRETIDLEILFEGDALLRNVYHLIVVNPRQGPYVNAEAAEALARYFLSAEALDIVRDFGRGRYGRPLFVPDPEPYGDD